MLLFCNICVKNVVVQCCFMDFVSINTGILIFLDDSKINYRNSILVSIVDLDLKNLDLLLDY